MNPDKYNNAAYRKVAWKEAARLLRETYFPESGSAPPLVSDEVFRAPREVPSFILQEVLVALNKAERAEETAMTRFMLEEISDDKVATLSEEKAEPPTPAAPKPISPAKKPAAKREGTKRHR